MVMDETINDKSFANERVDLNQNLQKKKIVFIQHDHKWVTESVHRHQDGFFFSIYF